jgi:hypothetical protein
MEELFYLKCTKTGRYHSLNGMVSSADNASKFTQLQLKNRLKVAKTHTNRFKEKLRNANLTMEPVVEIKMGEIVINSELPYEEDDILYCDTQYYYDNGEVLRMKSVYSVYRGILRKPKNAKGKLVKAVLNVLSVSGNVVK